MTFEAPPAARSWRSRHPSTSKATKLARLQRAVRRVTKQARPLVDRLKLTDLQGQHREELHELERELKSVEQLLEDASD